MAKRRHRRNRLVVAPGRQPDELDHILAAIRANDTFALPARQCRRCHRHRHRPDFSATEWAKQRPTCTTCAAAPIRTASPLPQPEPPTRRLAPHLTYRMRVAEDEEFSAWWQANFKDDHG